MSGIQDNQPSKSEKSESPPNKPSDEVKSSTSEIKSAKPDFNPRDAFKPEEAYSSEFAEDSRIVYSESSEDS
jgi:hypothetical protein